MEGLAKSKNVNFESCNTEISQNNPKMAIFWQNHYLKEKISKFFYWGSIEHTDWRYLPEFHADVSSYKEKRVYCTRYKKTPTFLPPFCACFTRGTKILTREIWVWPTYACKIYLDLLRLARVIREKLILSKILMNQPYWSGLCSSRHKCMCHQ